MILRPVWAGKSPEVPLGTKFVSDGHLKDFTRKHLEAIKELPDSEMSCSKACRGDWGEILSRACSARCRVEEGRSQVR
jgi:hypothetical protein